MRVAINLLTEDPEHPSGAHWFWTRVIPEMAKRLESGEELHLLVSPKSRPHHQGYGPGVRYITFPWSNEHRNPRTLSEQLYSPVRLPLSRIDVFNTLMAPPVNLSWSLVLHFKTMHHRGPGTRKGSYARPRIAAARKVTWGATAASTLDVYCEAAERREHRRK
jgi:hypothetical protein